MRPAFLGRLPKVACPDIERVTTSRTHMRFHEARQKKSDLIGVALGHNERGRNSARGGNRLPGSPSKTPPTGRPARQAAEGDERPPVVPAFDPAVFARDSEVKQRAANAARHEPTIDRARQLHLSGEHDRALSVLT